MTGQETQIQPLLEIAVAVAQRTTVRSWRCCFSMMVNPSIFPQFAISWRISM